MINRSLGSSKKFYRLADRAANLVDFCQALFPILVVTSDDHGCQVGDAFRIKHEVFPVSPHSEEDFEAALTAMNDVGLISLYSVEGRIYLYVHNFRREQVGIRYFGKQTCPDPPKEVMQNEHVAELDRNFGNFPKVSGDFGKFAHEVEVEVEVKNNKTTTPADAGAVESHPSVESFRLSERLKREISLRDPHSKAAALPDLTRWAQDIDKIIRIDGRKPEEVEAVIAWCQKDGFWGPNIQSGRKLRAQFDVLYGHMKRGASGNGKPKHCLHDLVGMSDKGVAEHMKRCPHIVT
jgi:hypothetical protein